MQRHIPTIVFLLVSTYLVQHSTFGSSAHAADHSPNILMIMIDDLGWMDLHCQGNQRLHTPHIDRLTGLAPARLQITNHIPDQERFAPKGAPLVSAPMLDHLSCQHETFSERLRSAGYATGFFGKWHLAGPRQPNTQGQGNLLAYPNRHGFDVNHGGCAMGGPFSFFDPFNLHTLPPKQTGQYMPDRLADELIGFIESNRNGPFLGVLWNYTVHWPMEAPADLIKKYQNRADLGRLDPRYAAMIEAMDASIGRIMQSLEEMDLANNTLVIFTSDNGAFGGVADNQPLRAAKGFLYEGGIRIPQIVRWPGIVKPGTVCDTPVISMDFFPTILAAANASRRRTHRIDGDSLLPLLTQTGELARDAIYFHYPNYAFHGDNRLGGAIRQGDFKLIERFDDGSLELYNLKDDIGETKNLAAALTDRAAKMQAQLQTWREETKAAMPSRSKSS